MTKFLTRVFRFIGSSIKPNRGERGVERGGLMCVFLLRLFFSLGMWGVSTAKRRGEDGATCVQIKKDTLVSLCAPDLQSGSLSQNPLPTEIG